jgi:fucose 4-O-acetylase-like acetyltransferase
MGIWTFRLEGAQTSPRAEARPLARPRLVYLDNLRTALIVGVVLAHLSITYGAPAEWYYKEGGELSPGMSLLWFVILILAMAFAMGLFMLIAGYCTPAAYDRRGPGRFMLDRLKRLGIPLLIFEVLINPLVHYMVDTHGGEDCTGSLYDCQYQGTFWQYMADYPRAKGSFGDGPVWFLEALLLISAGYTLWRIVASRRFGPDTSVPDRMRPVPGNGAIALFCLTIGLVTFVVRIWARVLVFYEPCHLEFAHFPQYIALFAAGAMAHRNKWFDALSDRQARTWGWIMLTCLLLLVPLLIAFGVLSGYVAEGAGGGLAWESLLYSVWEGFIGVAICITLLAWFRRRFNGRSRLAQTMAGSTFGVYVLHPAIIVPFTLAISGIRLNPSLKYLLTVPIAVTLCYLVVGVLRKVPVVRTLLG